MDIAGGIALIWGGLVALVGGWGGWIDGGWVVVVFIFQQQQGFSSGLTIRNGYESKIIFH